MSPNAVLLDGEHSALSREETIVAVETRGVKKVIENGGREGQGFRKQECNRKKVEFAPYDSRRSILQEVLSVLFGLMPLHLCVLGGGLRHRHGSAVEASVVEDYRVAMTEDVLSVFSDSVIITPYHHCGATMETLGVDLAQRNSALVALTTLSSWMKRLLRHYEELTSFYGMSIDVFFLPRDYHEWKESGNSACASEIGWFMVQRLMTEIAMYLSMNDFATTMDLVDQALFTLRRLDAIPLQLESIATSRQFPEVGASGRRET